MSKERLKNLSQMSLKNAKNENKLTSKTKTKSNKPKRPKKLRDKNKLRRHKKSALPPPTITMNIGQPQQNESQTLRMHLQISQTIEINGDIIEAKEDIECKLDESEPVKIEENVIKSEEITNDNDSKLPYYLRKNDFDNLDKIQPISANAYQKRKYREALKISNHSEWEYMNKYLCMKYGKRENNDYSDILKDIAVDFGNVIVKICIEMLLILHESWRGRMQIISTLVDQLCSSSISEDQYALKMCKFLHPIGLQFTDSRSLVIQEMKKQISRLCSNKPQRFIFFAPYILKQASNTWHGMVLFCLMPMIFFLFIFPYECNLIYYNKKQKHKNKSQNRGT